MDEARPLNPAKLKGHKFGTSLKFYIRSSFKEARRRKLYFCLAILSTLIAVAATAVCQTLMSYAPLIFLKAAESGAGSIDIQISPTTVTIVSGGSSRSKRLIFNGTKIAEAIESVQPDTSTPSYSLSSAIFVPNRVADCNSGTIPPYSFCQGYTSTFVLQDTAKEAALGMGDDLPLPEEIPYGYVIISTDEASTLSVKKGSSMIARMSVDEILQNVADKYNSEQEDENRMISTSEMSNMILYAPVTIYSVVSDLPGKFPDGQFADSVLYEYKHFFTLLAENPPYNLQFLDNAERFIEYVRQQNPQDYAEYVMFNMKNRLDVYMNSNFDKIQDEVISFGNDISNALGIFPYIMDLPVYTNLEELSYASLFLGITLKLLIVILFILSSILIYNLLMATLNNKTFEFGVIRTLGLSKLGIAQLILIQALCFVIPGIILGLAASIPLLVLGRALLENKLLATIPIVPTGFGFMWALIVGIFIPLVSSYYPVKTALSKDLNASLDTTRSKTLAIQVTVESKSKRIPWTQIVFGVLTVCFGVALYILLPLALVSSNLGLLLWLFFIILLGFLVGLTLLSLNFQHIMEKILTTVAFFWTKTFKGLVSKNLSAHRIRNRQVAIMYALSLGFVIFIKIALNQEISSATYQTQAEKGAYLQVSNLGTISDMQALEEALFVAKGVYIQDYAWVTSDLNTVLEAQGAEAAVTHKGQLYTQEAIIVGASPSFFEVSFSKFLKVAHSQNEETGLDLGEQLYTPRGSEGVIVGEYYRKYFDVDVEKEESIVIDISAGTDSRKEELRVLASLNSAAGLTFSNNPSVTDQNVLVSIPTFRRLAGDAITSYQDIPLDSLLIKAIGDTDANLEKASDLLNDLKQSTYPNMKIWDFRDSDSSLKSNESVLNIIFYAVEIMVIILSLFSLTTSMTTNIMEQTKEIAVLKAIGLRKLIINMLYVAEAFILVFSSALFGILIGTLVGYIFSVQRILFTYLPLQFKFPIVDLLIIFGMAVLSAFLSSFLPARRITKKQISTIARMGT